MAQTEFDRDQFEEAYPPGIERSWWHVARNRVIARTFDRHVPKGSRVLEVGCGTGIVTAALLRHGWNASGVDMGEPKRGLHSPEHLMLGTDALALPAELRASIDVLAFFDVIEHISDPRAFLRALLDAFPNAQHVVITVPARKELWTSFDDHYGHFRRYDLGALRDDLAGAGLRQKHARYFFHGVYPAILLNNVVRGRKRDIRFTAPTGGFSTASNRLIGSFFAAEATLFPGRIMGSSIIAVASRA